MVVIRPAIISDIDTLVGFQLKMAAETENLALDGSIVRRGLEALLSDHNKGSYYLACVDDKPVGCFLITFEWSDWRNGTVWWLQSVYVAEEARGQKVFSTMYAYLKDKIAGDPTVLGLRLYVDKNNRRAQKVYASLGMNGDHYTVFEWMK